MKYTPIGLLAAAALWALPTTALAQDDEEAAGDAAAEAEAPSEDGSSDAAEGDGDGDAAEGDAAEGGEGDEEAGLGDICEIDPEACPVLDLPKEAAKPLDETIFAVQQRFIIKRNRLELQPFFGFTLNDQFVSHLGPGLGINFYITEVLAVGVNGQYFEPFNVDSAFNAQVRRAARIGVPLTEYQWQAALNFTYVPISGKYSGFGNFIFHYDWYVVAGIGAISTRPIPVIDPDNRNFGWSTGIEFNAGLGLKIFFNRWFAAVLEGRTYAFNEPLENTIVAGGQETDPSTWYSAQTPLTFNVQAQLGVSVFVPFTFEYRLPKAGADTTGGAAK
jgi:outer membrane beta-barrel protein